MDERGVHADKPLRVGGVAMAAGTTGGRKGKVVPPSDKGVKMFEMAQLNVFSPGVNKGGVGHCWFLCHSWEATGLGV